MKNLLKDFQLIIEIDDSGFNKKDFKQLKRIVDTELHDCVQKIEKISGFNIIVAEDELEQLN